MTWLGRLARLGFGLASLCFLALSAQFLRLALETARPVAESPASLGSLLDAERRSPRVGSGEVALTGSSGSAVQGAPSASRATGVVRAIVYVAAGDGPRAEVFINGRRVGQTPFMGDLNCNPADPVKIELLPKKGAPWRRDMPCSVEIRVSPGIRD